MCTLSRVCTPPCEYTLSAPWMTGIYASFAWNHLSPLWLKITVTYLVCVYLCSSFPFNQSLALICRVYYTSMTMAVFLLQLFYHLFGVGLSAYFRNHSPFSREHIFEYFNEFPSLVYWCTVIRLIMHRPQPQEPSKLICCIEFCLVQALVATLGGRLVQMFF